MNVIYDEKGKELKTINDLTEAAGLPWSKDYPYEIERITGEMCDCKDGGIFDLLPPDDEAVIEGGKRYMECRICGRFSHL